MHCDYKSCLITLEFSAKRLEVILEVVHIYFQMHMLNVLLQEMNGMKSNVIKLAKGIKRGSR